MVFLIFVTVGTHEQSFNRLIKKVDDLKRENIINETVIIQIGFSTYKPKYCNWSKFIPYSQMLKNTENAHIVITHGGPASFIMPLQFGKIPIVVPRQKIFNEHVNDHQMDFVQYLSSRMSTIINIENIERLEKTIKKYDEIIKNMNHTMGTNNLMFNKSFQEIVDELFSK